MGCAGLQGGWPGGHPAPEQELPLQLGRKARPRGCSQPEWFWQRLSSIFVGIGAHQHDVGWCGFSAKGFLAQAREGWPVSLAEVDEGAAVGHFD